MAETVKELDKLIQEQEKNLAKLRRQKEKLEAQKLTPEQELAIELHKKLCRWTHTDGCGWYYEMKDGIHEWDGGQYSAHREWLKKAQKVIASGIQKETAIKLMEIV